MEELVYPKQITVLYAGKRLSSKNELYDLFYQLEDGVTKDSLSFSKIKSRFGIGYIYEIKQSSKDSFVVNNEAFKGKFSDENFILELSLKHKAATEAFTQSARIKKLVDSNFTIEKICKPLKEIYNSQSTVERQALLAYIIQIMTR